MWRWALAVTLAALWFTPAGAEARLGATELTKPQAIAAVRTVLRINATPCQMRTVKVTASHAPRAWRVAALTSGSAAGTSLWTVVRKPAPLNALARKIAKSCPQAPPPPIPPAPSTPPAGPGAPGTYTFGVEVNVAQQALVRRGLDAGARYYRSVLGRELPAFSVWGHTNLEGLIAVYSQTKPTSPEDARRLWEGGQVGHATPRKIWLGPAWFANQEESALKIAAHEAFHLLQYEIVGDRPLGVSGLDEIPPAGPWWLAEGSAEYFAYLAVVADGGASIVRVRGQWIQSARASAASLRDLATFRGQRETPRPYDVYALAVELLLRDRDPKLVFQYYEAIARGDAWPDAFTTTFGRTFEAFVAEFEANRRAA